MSPIKVTGLKRHFFSSPLFGQKTLNGSRVALAALVKAFGDKKAHTLSDETIKAIVKRLIDKMASKKAKDTGFGREPFKQLFVDIICSPPFKEALFKDAWLVKTLPKDSLSLLFQSSAFNDPELLTFGKLLLTSKDAMKPSAFTKFTDALPRQKLLFLVTKLQNYDRSLAYDNLSEDILKSLLCKAKFADAPVLTLGLKASGMLPHRVMCFPIGQDASTDATDVAPLSKELAHPLAKMVVNIERFPKDAHLSLDLDPLGTLENGGYVIYPSAPGQFKIAVKGHDGTVTSLPLTSTDGKWTVKKKSLETLLKQPSCLLDLLRNQLKVRFAEEPTPVIVDDQGRRTGVTTKGNAVLATGGFGVIKKGEVTGATGPKVVKKIEIDGLPHRYIERLECGEYHIEGNHLVLHKPIQEVVNTLTCKKTHTGLTNEDNLGRFINDTYLEAEIGQRFNHPNLVRTALSSHPYQGKLHVTVDNTRYQVYAQGPNQESVAVTGNKMLIVQDFIDGQELFKIIEQDIAAVNHVPEERKLKYFFQILLGVAEMHRQGIVHRDLKPENVMVDQNDTVKVIDFGLSRYVSERYQWATINEGSPGYVAPEIGRRNVEAGYETKSDAFSVAAIGFAMFFFKKVGFLGPRPREGRAHYYTTEALRTLTSGGSPKTKAIANYLIKMADTNPKTRLSVVECIEQLKTDPVLQEVFR
jgi:serine/threonine protein kinase